MRRLAGQGGTLKKQLIALLAVTFAAGILQADAVRFAVLGDRTGGHVEDIYEQVVAEVERMKPEFVITVGDQIEGGTDDTVQMNLEWREYYDSLTAALSMPLYLVPGNHDIYTDVMEPFYVRHTGRQPFYSFDHRGVHVVVLDNSRWESSQGFPGDQLDWLEQDLGTMRESRTHTLVFFHKPFWYERVAHGKPDPLHELFKSYDVDAVFSGHYHEYFSGVIDGITYTTVGSSGGGTRPGPTGTEYHFAWVTADENGVHVAPVRKGAVLEQEDVSVDDMLTIERIQLTGLRAKEPVVLTEDLTGKAVVGLEVRNSADAALDDTLRWELPEGWTVHPSEQALSVEPGGRKSVEFTVGCVGEPFPPPEATLDFPYAEGKTYPVTALLHVAREAGCARAVAAPTVDGDVSETCWQDPVEKFFAPQGGAAGIDPVKFYFAHDDENLYLAAVCRDEKPAEMASAAEERDGPVYRDDCVGYFLQPDTGKRIVYQVYFNPEGIAFDQRIVIEDDGYWDADVEWNGEYEVSTATGDDGWSIEARIPFDQLGVEDAAGTWGMNFRRKQPRLETSGDWQLPISYDPGTYGHLVLR